MHPQRLLLLAVLFLSSVVRADIPPPDLQQCVGKQEGVMCTTDTGGNGVCQRSKCYRRDYSKGFPPKYIEYECLKCVAAATQPQRASSLAPSLAPATRGLNWTALSWLSLALALLVAGWRMSRRRNQSA